MKYQKLTILWALFILFICSVNLGGVSHAPLFFAGFDKVTHCGLFFVTVIFWSNGTIRQQKVKFLSYKSAAIITAGAIFYGGVIEILQMTIFTWLNNKKNKKTSDAIGACMAIFSI